MILNSMHPEPPSVFWPELAGKRTLVTGASGFVGGEVANTLIRGPEAGRVIATCRNIAKGRSRIGAQAKNIIFERWEMSEPFPSLEGVDAIVHLAGKGDPQSYFSSPYATMRAALLGCLNILDYAVKAGVGKFVYVSSGEAYGAVKGGGRITETDQGAVSPLDPRSCYPVGKMGCESLCLAAGREYGLPVVLVRLSHVYGPGMAPADPRIAAQFPLVAARGHDIVLKSAGERSRSYCHVSDAATGILTALARGAAGEMYTVADENTELTVREFAERVANLAGVKVLFDLPSEVEKAVFNPMPKATFSAAKLTALGWKPVVGFDVGMRHVLDYLRGL